MSKLDDPISITGLRLRNRLALPPITTNYAAADGTATEATVAFHRLRSRHVGLAVVEAAAVRADGRITPYSLGIWSDDHLPGLSRLAEAIKVEGAAAFIQINHAGARGQPVEGGLRGASPSGFAFRPDVEPTALAQAQIDEIVADFVAAAARAARAGFDGVEIHGAHFYLISEFL
ncbi:MAG: oxidoreductase, partial [Chloroflexota bacterium]